MKLALLLALTFACCTALAQSGPSTAPSTPSVRLHGDPMADQSLKLFLQHYEGSLTSPHARTTRYVAAPADLRDDGTNEIIVYLIGPDWCGSGGCSCLVLQPKDSSFTIVTKTTITQLPIRVLTHKTNGWHDLAVRIGGGGVLSGYEVRLRFNGREYPSNPSVPPAERLQKPAEGQVVIREKTTGTPLF